jgi:hypothetical protein
VLRPLTPKLQTPGIGTFLRSTTVGDPSTAAQHIQVNVGLYASVLRGGIIQQPIVADRCAALDAGG